MDSRNGDILLCPRLLDLSVFPRRRLLPSVFISIALRFPASRRDVHAIRAPTYVMAKMRNQVSKPARAFLPISNRQAWTSQIDSLDYHSSLGRERTMSADNHGLWITHGDRQAAQGISAIAR
jgi:hypothetical protein